MIFIERIRALNMLSIEYKSIDEKNNIVTELKKQLSAVKPTEFVQLGNQLVSDTLKFTIENEIPIGPDNQHPLIALRNTDISKSIDNKGIAKCLSKQYVNEKGQPVQKGTKDSVLLFEYMHIKELTFKPAGAEKLRLNPLEMVIKFAESTNEISESNISATDMLTFYDSNPKNNINDIIQNAIVQRVERGETYEKIMCQLIDIANGKPKPSNEKLEFLKQTYQICQSTVIKKLPPIAADEQKMIEHTKMIFEAILKYCVNHPRITREVIKNQEKLHTLNFLGMPEIFDITNIFFALNFDTACKHVEQMKDITGGGKDTFNIKGNSQSQAPRDALFKRSATQSVLNAIRKIMVYIIYIGTTKEQKDNTSLKFLNGVKSYLDEDILPNITKSKASYQDVIYQMESHTYKGKEVIDYRILRNHKIIKYTMVLPLLSTIFSWIDSLICTEQEKEKEKEEEEEKNLYKLGRLTTNVYEEALRDALNNCDKEPSYIKGQEDEKNIHMVKLPASKLEQKSKEEGRHATKVTSNKEIERFTKR